MRASRMGTVKLSLVAAGVAVSGAVAGPGPATAVERPGPAGVERHLDSIRHDPQRLDAFMRELPKGGDLHSHLAGAATT